MGNTEADGANGILKNTTITVPWKYLSSFWRSLERPLINCKVELRLKWTSHCVLSANCHGSGNVNSNNIHTTRDRKLYVPLDTLSAKDNQKLPKCFSKGFERSVYCNEHRNKSENKNMTNEYRCFLESNFEGATRFFVLVYSNQDDNAKSIKPEGILHRKGYQKL